MELAGQDRTQVQAYPELIYGKKPSSATSTTPGLPQRLSGISRIEADYDIHTKASGCYNAAFELWLTRTSAADSADITSEIMIWVSRKGLRPAGSFLKSVETPHGTADLYEALSMPWRYLAFVLDQEMLTGRIDLSFFWSRSWLWAALILPCFWQASSLETRSLSDGARLG